MKIISPEEILKVSDPIEDTIELLKVAPSEVLRDMFELCRKHGGIAIAGPQVGIFKQFFVSLVDLQTGEQKPMIYINPYYTSKSDLSPSVEGCLSYNYGKDNYKVDRFVEIRASWYKIANSHLEKRTATLKGPLAIIFQHETDHLFGITIASKGVRIGASKLPQDYSQPLEGNI